ncbi:MAG: Ig-like domain-containing protein [Phycisphaerales bacterium]|nr:Ig-like domain-containing protein [Phycisphaerales bacterium]
MRQVNPRRVAAWSHLRLLPLLEGLEQRMLLSALNPTVNAIPATFSSTPAITGTVDDVTAAVSISILQNGNTIVATVPASTDGGGNWSFTPTDPLAPGTYDIQVTASNDGGDTGDLTVSGALTIKSIVTVTLNSANSKSAVLKGTVNTTVDTLAITVNGTTYTLANGDITLVGSTWSLPVTFAADGNYPVSITATDTDGNSQTTSNKWTIDTTAPTVAIDNTNPTSLGQNDTYVDPNTLQTVNGIILTGTYEDLNINGVYITLDDGHGDSQDFATVLSATSDTAGTWTAYVDAADLIDGATYTITLTASDYVNNTTQILTESTLSVDLTAPTVAFDSGQTTSSTKQPGFTGTVDDPTATIIVTINGVDYSDAVNHGDGTWSLAEGIVSPLPLGVYAVTVTATDSAGNVGAATQDVAIGTWQTFTLGSTITKLTYFDADGTTVTIKAGKGQVDISFLSDESFASTQKGKNVTITAGDIAMVDVNVVQNTASLSIVPKATKGNPGDNGLTSIGSITGEGNLKSLAAPKVSLTDGIQMSGGGVIQTIRLDQIQGDITMGDWAKGVAITANAMQNTTLATSFIKTLKIGSMTDCTINATFLNSLTSNGILSGVTINVPTITTLNVGTLTGCDIKATTSIKTLTVKALYQNTNVLAGNFQKATLTNVITDNNGTPFGLTANAFKQVTVTVNGSKAKLTWGKNFTEPINDFYVTVS